MNKEMGNKPLLEKTLKDNLDSCVESQISSGTHSYEVADDLGIYVYTALMDHFKELPSPEILKEVEVYVKKSLEEQFIEYVKVKVSQFDINHVVYWDEEPDEDDPEESFEDDETYEKWLLEKGISKEQGEKKSEDYTPF